MIAVARWGERTGMIAVVRWGERTEGDDGLPPGERGEAGLEGKPPTIKSGAIVCPIFEALLQ